MIRSALSVCNKGSAGAEHGHSIAESAECEQWGVSSSYRAKTKQTCKAVTDGQKLHQHRVLWPLLQKLSQAPPQSQHWAL